MYHFRNMKAVSVKGALFLLGSFLFLLAGPVFAETIDLDQDGTPDSEDEEVLVSTSQSLPAGEYTFRNLTVASNTVLTLVGDPNASGDFKGVKIVADNITIESGSSLSANGTGYASSETSPGAPEGGGGFGYGGRGGDWHYRTSSGIGGDTYGSAFEPKDLGSGASVKTAGGGAVWIIASGALKNDGIISANGIRDQASGGSIYVRTGSLEGAGTFTANGAGCYGFWPNSGAGGGGRIAVHYESSSFTGSAAASRGATGSNSTCSGERTGEEGTVVFVDTTNNDLYLYDRFMFQASDSPYQFNRINLSEGAYASSESGVSIAAQAVTLKESSSLDTSGIHSFTTGELLVDGGSVFTSAEGQSLNISSLTIQNRGVARLGRGEILAPMTTITLAGESQITATPMHVLHLEVSDISIDETSTISATGAGHPPGSGPGKNESVAGASHGGLGEAGTPAPTYGSETEPVDFGSGGSSDAYGGGSIRLIVSNTLKNDGTISADATPARNGASGGSVYITTKTLTGSGRITALGGNTRGYTAGIGAGGGGRVAVYYAESDFSGTVSAKGGDRYVGGPIQQWYYAQDGTVVLSQREVEEPFDPLLLKYLPILRMHPEEDYLPMNVEAFVGASALWDDAGILPDELREAYDFENPLTLERLATYENSEDLYLAFSDPTNSKSIDVAKGREKYENLVASGTAKVTVYAHRTEDSYEDARGRERTFTVLQYWYFYAMNDWKKKGGLNDHEGDWESVFVFLDEDEEPKYVAFSAHHNDGDDSLNPAQYDSVRREWSSNGIELDSTQVHSYVALGSHANYPRVGIYKAGVKFDQTSDEGVRIGPDDFHQKIEFVKNFPILISYEGKWGTDMIDAFGANSGPQGPNFIDVSGHKRFHEPIEWAGIDAIDEVEIEEPQSELTFRGSGIYMNFGSTTVPGGSEFRISPYREPIFSGTAPQSTTLLPVSWEIDSSVENDTFSAKVYFPIDETLSAMKEKLRVYLFNPITNAWEKQVSYLDESGKFVVLETTHFSRYALGYEEGGEVTTSEPEPVPAPPIVGSGSRTQRLRVTEVALADAVIVEKVISSEEQITILVQQALVLIVEYVLDVQKERNLTTEELKMIESLLKEILESLD